MWLLAAVAVFILLALWLPHTPIPDKGKEYITKAWNHVSSAAAAGVGGSASNETTSTETAPTDDEGMAQMAWGKNNTDSFDFDKWFFQFDLENTDNPSFDVERLKHLAPHNYQGPGGKAFATFFATRSPSLFDPYFMATQQGVFRLLWDQRSRSRRYPVIVFVTRFATQEQRDMFSAAGAIVRELDLVPFHPVQKPQGGGVAGRLIDMFSKLEMWKQTDFSRIMYMDSDAFALENIDRAFTLAPQQRCKVDLLLPADLTGSGRDMCDYVFAGHSEHFGSVNAGVIIIKPNLAMHEMLIRESSNMTNYDQGLAEQSFVNYIFRPQGPFPPSDLENAWNGYPQLKEDGEDLFIVHGKIWVPMAETIWAHDDWSDTWSRMLELYNSDEFVQLRERDEEVFQQIL
jgi:alpha-N-acetylglucosamine transferase